MGHVHHKARAHAVGDGGHALKVDDARVRRGARDDQRGALRTGGASRRPVDQQGRIRPMTPAPITANVPQPLQPLSTRAPWRTRPMPGTSKATKAAAPLLAMPPPFQILRWTRPLSLSAGMGLSNSSSPPMRSLNDRLTNQPVELQRSTRSFAHLTDLGIASGGPERCYILTTHRTHLPSRSR